MKKLILLLLLFPNSGNCQNYVNYFTGSGTDAITVPQGGVCLMGGASEHDEAMKWFLQRANGGDILVLRASGSDGYNDYMFSQLGIPVNSVETIVFNNANASNDVYVKQKIEQAEAIWFAGGDQWDYISYWRNSAVDSLINIGLTQRNIVIGGTSAGMAIQGKYYYSAENGSVTSSVALSNPYDFDITVDSASFIKNNYLEDVITDTHYDNPIRKGRHTVFLSRILSDYGITGKGIACDEYTAICIDQNGLARAFGDSPNYNENVYFIQPNCELQDYSPENCTDGNPLTWNRNGKALKVYHILPTMDGSKTFDLSDWSTGSGGNWEDWSVSNGTLQEISGNAISCSLGKMEITKNNRIQVYPNPASNHVFVNSIDQPIVYNFVGAEQRIEMTQNEKGFNLNISQLPKGIYFVHVSNETLKFVKE